MHYDDRKERKSKKQSSGTSMQTAGGFGKGDDSNSKKKKDFSELKFPKDSEKYRQSFLAEQQKKPKMQR